MSSTENTTPSMRNGCGGNEGLFDCAEFMQTMQEMCTSKSEGEKATDCCAKMQQMCCGETEAATRQQK